MGKPAFWLAMVLGTVAALLPDLALAGLHRAFLPSDVHLVQAPTDIILICTCIYDLIYHIILCTYYKGTFYIFLCEIF